jgi:nitrous oxidase accessory protein
MGIGVKDTDGLVVEDNQIIRDNTGVYLDASPAIPDKQNIFRRNLIALNNTAVVFHATEANTGFVDNSFRDNQAVTSVEGEGDALKASWKHNFYDDYQGYDLNRDGFGDVAYELRSFSTQLIDSYPDLAFFRGSPVMGLLEFFSKVFPYLQPKLILRDAMPRMNAPHFERLSG